MHQAGVGCLVRDTTIGCAVLGRAGALVIRGAAIVTAISLGIGAVAQDSADGRSPAAPTNEHEPAAHESRGAEERTGARERRLGRRQAPQGEHLDVVAPAAPERDADVVPPADTGSAPLTEQRVQRLCRERAVTGTRFARRECMTAEQWAEVDARQASQGRRFARDVQSQSATLGEPGEGGNTPEGRPSGLPNPGGL